MKNRHATIITSISSPSESSVPMPNCPIVYAIAPKAPIAETYMMMPDHAEQRVRELIDQARRAACPSLPMWSTATPNSTEKNRTCRMSPVANALTIVVGMMFIRKSIVVRCDALRRVGGDRLRIELRRARRESPAPGFMTLTNTMPMTSAIVETTSK